MEIITHRKAASIGRLFTVHYVHTLKLMLEKPLKTLKNRLDDAEVQIEKQFAQDEDKLTSRIRLNSTYQAPSQGLDGLNLSRAFTAAVQPDVQSDVKPSPASPTNASGLNR